MAALAITSCSQSEDAAIPYSGDQEISFNTVVNKSTRATAMVTDQFSDFTVYGYKADGDFDGSTALGTVFMDGISVTKTDAQWTVAGGPYYWPAKGKVQFFAYSPATSVKSFAVGNPAGFPSFSYTIQDQQEDLLAAQVLNAEKSENAVQLSFSHLLTQINFSAELEEGFKYEISSIKVTGVQNTGTFTYAASKGAWTGTSGAASYEYTGNFAATVTDNVVNFATDNSALMLMPQTLPADAKIEVTYKATATTGNKEVTFDDTKTVSLSGAIWTPGQNIRYKLLLPSDGQAVEFQPLVEDGWSDTNATEEEKDAKDTKDVVA